MVTAAKPGSQRAIRIDSVAGSATEKNTHKKRE